MKPIGGFFELELPKGGKPYHQNALALSTGRACISVMLKHLRPQRCFVPFYTCDATLEPFRLYNVPFEYFAINQQLEPEYLPVLGDGEYFLWINFFGIKSYTTAKLIKKYGKRLLIDDTHLFFKNGYAGNWSFTSARKYFGVPDGAYLYAPEPIHEKLQRFSAFSIQHNVNRLVGNLSEAYEQYVAYERSLNSDIHAISILSEQLLSAVDFQSVMQTRKQNFRHFHKQLNLLNTLSIEIPDEDVPFCYPFLPTVPMDKKAFYKEQFFIPSLWLDTEKRNEQGFEWEKEISQNLFPLPIDHRYNTADLDRLISFIKSRC